MICMCHMCECGMHKCPAKHTSSLVHYPVDMGSEYTRTYQAWPPQDRRRQPRPSRGTDEEKSQAFVGVTTHMVDYCPKKLPQRHVARPLGEKTLDHCIPEGDYSRVSTEYKEHYKQKPLQSRLPPKKPANIKADGSGHFDGTTTHQTDFRRWPIRARAPVKPAVAVCCIDGGENNLDDTTTYKVAYWDKSRAGGHARPSMRKKAGAASTSSNAPFYSETTHHADYGPKPIPNRRASPAVKHEKDSLANPHANFCGETTYHDTYKAWQVRLPRRGEVLKSNLAPVDTKFSGESLYHTDFKAPKLPKRCPALLRARPQQIVGDHFVY